MKPVLLEFCGINSFSEPARIDFSSLLDMGLFGIFGDTGSGKSTVLDCIGFALYGNISRARDAADIINYRKDRGYVTFVFEICYEGRRRTFRIEREIKRKKDGKSAQDVAVYERTEDGTFVTLANSVAMGNALLLKIVGLKQEDFEKCIALPQGEFARFVKEKPKERLEIISRLFDLERFGSGLSQRAFSRARDLKGEVDVLTAQLEPYADISKEGIEALEEELRQQERLQEAERGRLLSLREAEKELSGRAAKRRELEQVCSERERLLSMREEMNALGRELSRLSRAKDVVSAEKERSECEIRLLEAQRRAEAGKAALQKAQADCEELSSFDEEKVRAQIEQNTARLSAAEASASARKDRDAAKEELDMVRRRIASIGPPVLPDYEKQRAELLEKQRALGAGDLYSFLEAKKDALFRGEYETFLKEIKELERKYPETAGDTKLLIARYEALSEGEKLSFSALKGAFEAWESARNAAQECLHALDKQRDRDEANAEKLTELNERAERLSERIEQCSGRITEDDPVSLRREIAQTRKSLEDTLALRRRYDRALADAQLAYASAEADRVARRDASERADARMKEALGEVFSSPEEAEELLKRFGGGDAQEKLESYKNKLAAVDARFEELSACDCLDATDEKLSSLRAEIAQAESNCTELEKSLAVGRKDAERERGMLQKKIGYEEQLCKKQAEGKLFEQLTRLLRGGNFMEFVAEEYLQTVAANASGQLLSLTSGRYFLRYGSGSGFCVGDNFNAGQLRAVSTLSGGETFLVSLSLALSLSAEICARSARPIEFFFLDEGFGTLDEKLVDTVMDSLEKLRKNSFCIGIISHVEELKRRIERKLTIAKATEQHGSQIHAE